MSNDYYESHRGEWQWQDGEYTVTRTTAWSGPGCHDGCGVLYYTKDGKLEKVEGDPDNPFNQGALCMRCLEMPEFVNNPTRLGHPMKRAGERGENKWERVSWGEALDLIEEKVRAIWKDYGPESIVCFGGTGREACIFYYALNNLFAFMSALDSVPSIISAILPSVMMTLAAIIAMWYVERRS